MPPADLRKTVIGEARQLRRGRLLDEAELHRLVASGHLDRLGHLADPLGCRARDRENRLGVNLADARLGQAKDLRDFSQPHVLVVVQRQHPALRFGQRLDALGRQGVRMDLAVDVRLAHPARDQLRVLTPEIEDNDHLFPHSNPLRTIFSLPVIVAALGYFVDIYDLVLFSIVRVPSLKALGLEGQALIDQGVFLLNMQMAGMLLGGILWGILGDRKGRLKIMFASIFLYSVANLANAFVDSLGAYAVLRFVAGIGLAAPIEVDLEPAQRRDMMDRTGRRTVPQIYIGDTHVGGYDDLAALDRAGKLDALLRA